MLLQTNSCAHLWELCRPYDYLSIEIKIHQKTTWWGLYHFLPCDYAINLGTTNTSNTHSGNYTPLSSLLSVEKKPPSWIVSYPAWPSLFLCFTGDKFRNIWSSILITVIWCFTSFPFDLGDAVLHVDERLQRGWMDWHASFSLLFAFEV